MLQKTFSYLYCACKKQTFALLDFLRMGNAGYGVKQSMVRCQSTYRSQWLQCWVCSQLFKPYMVTYTPNRQESQSKRKRSRDKMCDSEDMMKNKGSKNTAGGKERWNEEVVVEVCSWGRWPWDTGRAVHLGRQGAERWQLAPESRWTPGERHCSRWNKRI